MSGELDAARSLGSEPVEEFFHNWEALGQDYPLPLFDPATGREIYPCDLPTCRAQKFPETLELALVTIDHLGHHSYLGGCSHAR